MATYETFKSNWDARLQPFIRAGADESHISKLAPIIRNDFQKLQRGEEPMDEATAIATLVSVATGKPFLKEPSNPGGIRNILGNVGKDIAGIASFLMPHKLIPALVNEGEQIGYMLGGKLKQEDQGNPLRNLAATPGIRLVPGIWTLANLTTPEGRKTITEHPVSTVLDVLPLAGSALKAGAAIAPAAGMVDRTSVVSKLAQQKVLTDAGRAATIPPAARLSYPEAIYAAAAEGKPVGAVLAASGMKPVLDAAINPVTQWLRTNTQLSRSHAVETRKAQAEINAFNKSINPLFEKMTAEERVALGNEWTQPDLYPVADAHHLAILQEGRRLNRRFAAQGVAADGLVAVNVNGKDFFYPREGAVDVAIKKQLSSEADLTKAIRSVDEINARMVGVTDPLKLLELQSKRDQSLRRLDRAKKSSLVARRDRNIAILEHAPREFHPMLQRRIHEQAVGAITGQYRAREISYPEFKSAMDKFKLGDYAQVFGKKNFDKIVRDIESTWTSLLDEGYEPLFLHNVPGYKAEQLTRGRVNATTEFKPGQFRETELSDMSPYWTDVGVGLTAAESEYVKLRATERMITDHVIPRGLTYDEAIKAFMPEIEKLVRKKGLTEAKAKAEVFDKHLVEVDNPDKFGFKSVRAHANMGGRTLYFDKATFNAAKKLTESQSPKTLAGRIGQRSNAIFKTSLFALSLKHVADELLGNTFLLATTGTRDTFSLSTLKKSIEMAHNPDVLMPFDLSRGIDISSAETIQNVAHGKTLGRVFKTIKGDSLMKFNEFVNKVQKSMAYLGEEKHLLREGLDPDIAKELAIRHANDALVDFDAMMPVERTIIRQVFPFYSWTKFLAQFLVKYPMDHPYRASFFNRMADMENTDEASGLPRYFRNLFFLGDADDEGNITALDVRVTNPLRDSANLASLAGFVSSVSPVLDVGLRSLGVDTLAGAPEMFPELTYNPETGKLEARRTSLTSKAGVMEMLGQFIPPTQTIDHFITVTDRLKRLKAVDPISYRRQLFSALGIPFVPYQESIPKAQARQQKALTEAARAVVSRSTRQNASTRDLRRYPIVPWQGQLVSGEGLANLIDKLHSVSDQSGIPTRMLMDQVAKAVK